MPSTIPRFKGALLARLQADTSLAGIQVSWGNPHPARLADELIVIDAATARQTLGSMGTRQQDERYTLDIIVSVTGPARATQLSMPPPRCRRQAAWEHGSGMSGTGWILSSVCPALHGQLNSR